MSFKAIGITLLLGAMLAPAPALAQEPPGAAQAVPPGRPLTAADLDGLRVQLRSSQKQMVAQNLKLTDAEATRFWPVYDQYAADMQQVRNAQYALIAEYANTYGKYDDKAAAAYIARWLDIDTKTTALRAKYVPLVGKALPGVKTATFFQIDRRVSMAIELRMATLLPLLQMQSQYAPAGR
jgi:Spy/CpxP family protein refolding chaperone